VITGDKQETAINIAISCKLIRHPDSLLICNADSPEEAAQRISDLTAQVCFFSVCVCYTSSLLKITCCVSTAVQQAVVKSIISWCCVQPMHRACIERCIWQL